MAREIKAKLITRLREQGMSRRQIAKTRRMSMGSVCEVFPVADERSIGRRDIEGKSDEGACVLLCPDRHVRGSVFEEPDWGYARKEMARVGASLRLPRDGHEDGRRRTGKVAMGHARFCERRGKHVAANSPARRAGHKAGQSCEVDWSGPTLGRGLVDPTTGEVSKTHLFVGVLPLGQRAYLGPTPGMRERTWPGCHVHTCEYWGGVPERTVCDNPETGVVRHPREGEVVPDDAYEAPGEHHVTAIMPAQVRKPKQKASAEGTAGDAATWVMAQPHDATLADFGRAKAAVREKLDERDAHPSRKRRGSRDPAFAEAEAAELSPLPDVRYDVAEWVHGRSVALDSRVAHERNRHSAPHRYVGRRAGLRVGESTVSACHAGERIATHSLLPECAGNGCPADRSHMPEALLKPEWDDARIRGRAKRIGPSCLGAVGRIFARAEAREQARDPALSVPDLSKKYGDERPGVACAYALPRPASPRHRHPEAILDANLGQEGPAEDGPGETRDAPKGHVRGADYHRD